MFLESKSNKETRANKSQKIRAFKKKYLCTFQQYYRPCLGKGYLKLFSRNTHFSVYFRISDRWLRTKRVYNTPLN